MDNIRIVTDSTADLSMEQINRYGISVVPIQVIMGDETYRDGVDLSVQDFYHRLETDIQVVPRTAQPPVSAFLQVYRQLMREGAAIISLHISGRLSGTLNSAQAAQQELEEGTIELIDTKTASQGVARTVLIAAEAARRGLAMSEILALARTSVENTFSVFAVDTLEYLRRNGRIGRATALLGSLLKVKPILYADADGMVAPYGKVRGKAKVIPRLVEAVQEQFRPGMSVNLSVVHSGARESALALLSELRRIYTVTEQHVGMVGPAIGAHVGPGALAIMCQPSFDALMEMTLGQQEALAI